MTTSAQGLEPAALLEQRDELRQLVDGMRSRLASDEHLQPCDAEWLEQRAAILDAQLAEIDRHLCASSSKRVLSVAESPRGAPRSTRTGCAPSPRRSGMRR